MHLEQFLLTDKVAIVTGGGRGLGKQMVLALAGAGAHVVVAARTQEQIDSAAADVRALGRRAIAVRTDVRDSAQVDSLVARCLDEFGRLDIMLSNAGIGEASAANKEPWEITDELWLRLDAAEPVRRVLRRARRVAANDRTGWRRHNQRVFRVGAARLSAGYRVRLGQKRRDLAHEIAGDGVGAPQHSSELHNTGRHLPGTRKSGGTKTDAGRYPSASFQCSVSARRGKWDRSPSSSLQMHRAI